MPHLIQIKLILTSFLIAFAQRLPGTVVPEEYKLQIITNLGDEGDSFNFKGAVLIHIKCVSPTESITLHSKNLKVDEEKIILRNLEQTEDSLTISGISQDDENDFLILTLSQTLQANGHYEIELYFEGDLGEEKVGYYRSSYSDDDDKKKWLGVTYFKPNYARRAFPCFDELTFKANFTISLGRSTKYKSLSNMPVLKTEEMENKPGWEWDHFQTTPYMSTYIVGFALMDFKHRDTKNRGVRLSIWGNEHVVSAMFIALEFSASFMDILKINLGMGYVLPKLDMVVLPDYAVRVMDSWGLIIWQEEFLMQTAMLLLGFNSEFMDTVAEQIVRQVLGNLVTIKSWADLWFIEGFSMYLSALVVDSSMVGMFELVRSKIADNIMSISNFDSLRNSQTVSIISNQSESTGTITDENTRKKIFLLIRMFSNSVGKTELIVAIHYYLKIYKYNNAGSEELLEILEFTNYRHLPRNVDVKVIIDTWTKQAGFPLITVTRDYKRGTLKVKQERFYKDSELLGTDTTRWWTPLTYTTECELDFNRTLVRKWLSPNEDSMVTGPLSPDDWVIFNVDASGLYMVNYDERNWHLIVDFLNAPFFENIPSMNRVLLINDAANLAFVGRLDYRIFFDMLRYIARETHDHPKYAAIRRIDDLNALLKRTPIHGRFLDYVREILQKGLNEEEISRIGRSGMRKISTFVRLHQRSGFGYTVATLLLQETIFCIGSAVRENSWNEYMKSKMSPDRRNEILRSLTCCRNETLLQTYLEKSLDQKSVGSEDVLSIIAAMVKNKHAFDLVREFLAQNIKTIHDRFPLNLHKVSPVLNGVARHIVSEDELTWLKDFIDTNREYLQDVQNGADEALEIAKLNVQWHRERYGTIETYLNEISDD